MNKFSHDEIGNVLASANKALSSCAGEQEDSSCPSHFFGSISGRQNHLGRTRPRAAMTAVTHRSDVAVVSAAVFLVASSRRNIMVKNGPEKMCLDRMNRLARQLTMVVVRRP